MGTLLQDLRYGLRVLRIHPAFALIAVVTLALGIGATTSIFSVVNAVLLRPLPYASPERIVVLFHHYRANDFRASVSVPGFLDYQKQTALFQDIAAVRGWNATLTGRGEPERLQGFRTSASYFRTIGMFPILGRDFRDEEDTPGQNRVVILSHGLWQRRFAGAPSIIGSSLTINGADYTVVGVMPPQMWLPSQVDVFTPIAFQPDQTAANRRNDEYLSVVARLKDGVSLDQARAQMEIVSADLRRQFYPAESRWAVGIELWQESVVRGVRSALVLLLTAVVFVLLISCANVANLLLARSSTRRKEIAVRTAMGASRSRVVRQLLTESLILALSGGAIGTVLAFAGLRGVTSTVQAGSTTELMPAGIPRLQEASIDYQVLGFTLLISIVTGIVFGLAPAFQMTRRDSAETLKEAGRGSSPSIKARLLGHALVVAEVSLALVLFVGAGLLVKSFLRAQEVKTGFQASNVLTFRVSLPAASYPDAQSSRNFFDRATESIATLPGIEAVGATSVLPLSGTNSQASFDVDGLTIAPGQVDPHGDYWIVTPDYFRALGIPLIKGRYFTDQDRAESDRLVIIDETLAAKYFPNVDPIGRHIGYGRVTRWREIVGVVGHAKNYGLEGEDKVQVYIPYQQNSISDMFVVVRGSLTPAMGPVREALRQVDPNLPVYDVRMMNDVVSNALGARRFSMSLILVFAAVALVLASVGIYGVMAYTVAQRTHEIGVRVALGARRNDVFALVLRQGLLLGLIGVIIGLGGALALSGLMAGFLFQVNPTDALTFGSIGILFVAIALLASYVPARRATRIDPVAALRSE